MPRQLSSQEISMLEKQGNRASHWGKFWVTDPFQIEKIWQNVFEGKIVLGPMKKEYVERRSRFYPVGIYNSRVVCSTIGADNSIERVSLLFECETEEEVVLFAIDELSQSSEEASLVRLTARNERGGRSILLSPSLSFCGAWLWSEFRKEKSLQEAFERLSQEKKPLGAGKIGRRSLIEGCHILRGISLGPGTLLSGCTLLQEVLIKSSLSNPTQIGEGVVLRSGIVGEGSVLSESACVKNALLDKNVILSGGVTVADSVIGEKSIISCGEILSSFVFPCHNQHHKNSFLCGATIMGQSNIAAGATVGANHNGRVNDGELRAGRGFWCGLSVNLKHNSRFASFSLVTMGSYPYQINNPLPFSLISRNLSEKFLTLMPAYWFLYNMYGLEKIGRKPQSNVGKKLNYLSPDTAEEISRAIELLKMWGEKEIPPFTVENSPYPVRLVKVRSALTIYKKMLRFYALSALLPLLLEGQFPEKEQEDPMKRWENWGGTFFSPSQQKRIREKLSKATSWEELEVLCRQEKEFDTMEKQKQAMTLLERHLEDTTLPLNWRALLSEARLYNKEIVECVLESRQKDYKDPFRLALYESEEECYSVLGEIEEDPLIKIVRQEAVVRDAEFAKAESRFL